MLGLISFLVVLGVLSAALQLIFTTLENASDAIMTAIRGEARTPIGFVKPRSYRTRKFVVTRPAFAPMRVAA